jgi:ribonucleoside-diphosphate reductase alpha chain
MLQPDRSPAAPSTSPLCTEILEITSGDETAVCNLGSINLGRHTTISAGGDVRLRQLARTVRSAVRR